MPRLGAGRCRAPGRSSRRKARISRSRYFLTFLYLPPAEDAARAESWLYEGRDRDEGVDAREVLRGFVDRTDRVLQLVEGFMPEAAGSMTRRR